MLSCPPRWPLQNGDFLEFSKGFTRVLLGFSRISKGFTRSWGFIRFSILGFSRFFVGFLELSKGFLGIFQGFLGFSRIS